MGNGEKNENDFIKDSYFLFPGKFLFGFNSIKGLGVEAKALFVTDRVIKAGMIEWIKSSLESQGISYTVFDKVVADPPIRIVEECVRWIKDEDIDILMGLGEGSSLGTAKGVAIMALNPGKILDYCGKDVVPRRGLPKILIPTPAGTGSEVTKVLIVTDEEERMKRAIYSNHVLENVTIIDPKLTLSIPQAVQVDTGVDAFVHAIETFVARTATPFSDLLAIEAIRIIAKSLPVVYVKG